MSVQAPMSHPRNKNKNVKECRYFNTLDGCIVGDTCRFLHNTTSTSNYTDTGREINRNGRTVVDENLPPPEKKVKKKNPKVKNINCKFGRNCKHKNKCSFRHPADTPINKHGRSVKDATLDTTYGATTSTFQCVFGTDCNFRDCHLTHAGKHGSKQKALKTCYDATTSNCNFGAADNHVPNISLKESKQIVVKTKRKKSDTRVKLEHDENKKNIGQQSKHRQDVPQARNLDVSEMAPPATNKAKIKMCRFGSKCTNIKCKWGHEPQKTAAATYPNKKPPKKYDIPLQTSTTNNGTGSSTEPPITTKKQSKKCRFGSHCNRKRTCKFDHSTDTETLPKNKAAAVGEIDATITGSDKINGYVEQFPEDSLPDNLLSEEPVLPQDATPPHSNKKLCSHSAAHHGKNSGENAAFWQHAGNDTAHRDDREAEAQAKNILFSDEIINSTKGRAKKVHFQLPEKKKKKKKKKKLKMSLNDTLETASNTFHMNINITSNNPNTTPATIPNAVSVADASLSGKPNNKQSSSLNDPLQITTTTDTDTIRTRNTHISKPKLSTKVKHARKLTKIVEIAVQRSRLRLALHHWNRVAKKKTKEAEQKIEKLQSLVSLLQKSITYDAFQHWTKFDQERKRKRIQEEAQRILQTQKKNRQDFKAKKQRDFVLSSQEEEKKRVTFWKDHQQREESTCELIAELCAAEFVRQNRDTMVASVGNLNVEKLKSDETAINNLRKSCSAAYRSIFPDSVQKLITVVDYKRKDLHNRSGTIMFWDAQKKKFNVALETKKKKAEIIYLKAGHLELREDNNAKIDNYTAKQATSIETFNVFVKHLFMSLSLDTTVTRNDITILKNMASDKAKLDTYLKGLMERRSEEEIRERARMRKMEEEVKAAEARYKIEREERRRREEEKHQEEMERRKAQQVMYEMAQQQRREQQAQYGQQHRHHRHGMGCRCEVCLLKNIFFFSSRFGEGGFFFDDDSDDEDDYFYYGGARGDEGRRRYYEEREKESEQDVEELEESAELLGVDVDVSHSELKSKFRKLALKYHPDKYSPATCDGRTKEDSEEHFKKISNAYQMLKAYMDHLD